MKDRYRRKRRTDQQAVPAPLPELPTWLRALSEEITSAVTGLGVALAPAFTQVADALNGMHAGLRGAYRNAGAPYGDTTDGLLRWLEEQVQAVATPQERGEAARAAALIATARLALVTAR